MVVLFIYLFIYSFIYKGRELTLNAFKSGIFPIRATRGKGLKILTQTNTSKITNSSCTSRNW